MQRVPLLFLRPLRTRSIHPRLAQTIANDRNQQVIPANASLWPPGAAGDTITVHRLITDPDGPSLPPMDSGPWDDYDFCGDDPIMSGPC